MAVESFGWNALPPACKRESESVNERLITPFDELLVTIEKMNSMGAWLPCEFAAVLFQQNSVAGICCQRVRNKRKGEISWLNLTRNFQITVYERTVYNIRILDWTNIEKISENTDTYKSLITWLIITVSRETAKFPSIVQLNRIIKRRMSRLS